jgi:hypothetical protein
MKTVMVMETSGEYVVPVPAVIASQWGAHARDPLARNDEPGHESQSENSPLIDVNASSSIEL